MKKISCGFLIPLLLLTDLGFCQSGMAIISSWYVRAMINTKDNSLVLGGEGEHGASIQKINSSGKVQWSYSLKSNDTLITFGRLLSIAETKDEGIIAAGYLENELHPYNITILKLNKSGSLNWIKYFSYYSSFQWAFGVPHIKIAEDVNRNILLLLEKNDAFFVDQSSIIKLDSMGNFTDQIYLPSLNRIYINDFSTTQEGGGVLLANEYSSSTSKSSILKLNVDFDIEWQYYFDNNAVGLLPLHITQTKDNNYCISGPVASNDTDHSFFLKLKSNGDIAFAYKVEGSINSIAETNDNHFILTGNGTIYKLNESGDLVFGKTVSPLFSYNDYGITASATTSDFGAVVACAFFNSITQASLCTLLKTDDYPGFCFNTTQCNLISHITPTLLPDTLNVVHEINISVDSTMSAQLISISTEFNQIYGNLFSNQEIKSEIFLVPNPTTAFLNVVTSEKFDNWSIYNTLGEIILNGTLCNDDRDFQLNVRTLARGMYFLKLYGKDTAGSARFMKI